MSHLELTIRVDYMVGALLVVMIIAWLLRRPLGRLMFGFDQRGAEILSQKKSSEVKTGRIVESIAPLLDRFPVDVKKPGTSTVFLGQPIDYIHFDPEQGITVVEVKSGAAGLNAAQKKLRELVKAGKVFWREFRVDS